jgi:hypothetical protein
VSRLPLLRAALCLGTAALIGGALTTVSVRPAIAQQGPIRLFPELDPPSPHEPEVPSLPEQPGNRTAPTPRSLLPSAPGGAFTVEGLAAPAVDAIGLIGPGEGAFDRMLWQGSDPDAMLAQLSDLPVVTRIPPLRRLTRRLLVTGSPVAARSGPGRLLAARVARLIAMGDLEAARSLVDQLPPPATDSELARSAAEVALLLGDQEAACRLAETAGRTTPAEFWGKVGVYCRLATGDRDGARLGLDLLREAGQTDDRAFFDLATAIADEAAAPALSDLVRPSPIHVALLGLGDWPLPADALAVGAEPPVLAAVARQPALAGAQPLATIEQAFAVGAATAEQVAAWYVKEAGAPDAADLTDRIRGGWDADTRAIAYLGVREQAEPFARAELIDAIWRGATGAERFLVAEVWAEPIRELPVDPSVAGAAPGIARALLAADLPVPAARWLSILEADAARDTRSSRHAADLGPLFALAGIDEHQPVSLVAPALESSDPAAVSDARAARMLALLDGLGVPVEATAQRERPESAPAGALRDELERAAAQGRLGETVASVLYLLDGQPEAADPEVLAACLRALNQVGLERDARAIAVATALSDGW